MGLAAQSARRTLARAGYAAAALRSPVDVEHIGRRLGMDLVLGSRVSQARKIAYRLGFQGSSIGLFAGELVMPEVTVRHLANTEDRCAAEIAEILGIEVHDVTARLAHLGIAPARVEAMAA